MLSRIWAHFEEGFIALLLVAMTLLVFFEVVLRFGFDTGLLWIEELTLHVSGWLVLFGASYGVKVHAHIGVDAVVRLLSAGTRRIVGLVAVALSLLYCGLFLAGGWVYIEKLIKIGIEMEDLPVPKWLAHSVIVIGFALLGLRLLELLWRIVKGQASGFELPDEARKVLDEADRDGLTGDRQP
ncbi:MAG: TRAP transporter small permease [Alphaproteobacteria bacterium]|nr:TRAP transporter small permease [Alphaproteobacteria bacterium]